MIEIDEHEALRGPHALHQRHGVDVPRRVAPRAHGHRDRRQQHRGETRQIEKSAGAVDGGVQLPAGFVDLAQPLAGAPWSRRRYSRNSATAAGGAGEQRRIGHAAARLDQLRRRYVVIVDAARPAPD